MQNELKTLETWQHLRHRMTQWFTHFTFVDPMGTVLIQLPGQRK